jgi:hypothetical protein
MIVFYFSCVFFIRVWLRFGLGCFLCALRFGCLFSFRARLLNLARTSGFGWLCAQVIVLRLLCLYSGRGPCCTRRSRDVDGGRHCCACNARSCDERRFKFSLNEQLLCSDPYATMLMMEGASSACLARERVPCPRARSASPKFVNTLSATFFYELHFRRGPKSA